MFFFCRIYWVFCFNWTFKNKIGRFTIPIYKMQSEKIYLLLRFYDHAN